MIYIHDHPPLTTRCNTFYPRLRTLCCLFTNKSIIIHAHIPPLRTIITCARRTLSFKLPVAMCIPYIYRVDDPRPQKRGRNGAPRTPLSVRATKVQPPNVTFSAEFSPRLIYRTPSNTKRAINPNRRRPNAPHPTPEMQYVQEFAVAEQVGVQEKKGLDEAERKVEEGRAGLPEQAPIPPAPGASQPPPQHQTPFGWPEAPPIPNLTDPERLETRSPYSYIRRPPPGKQSRQRSRSSSASSISRRSFDALSRKVNTMLDRLIRIERWRDERDAERRSKRVRWELGPDQSKNEQTRRERSRGRDADVERERLRERERWDWEGGGLGR